MKSGICALLLLAAVLGASAARELSADGAAGRQLLQGPSPQECDRSIKNCESCRFQFFRGTTTKVRLWCPAYAARSAPPEWLAAPAAQWAAH